MSYPQTKLSGLTGFAKAASVTGGWSGSVVSITTLDQLKKNIADNSAVRGELPNHCAFYWFAPSDGDRAGAPGRP